MRAKDRMKQIRQVAYNARRTYMLGRHYAVILGHAQHEVLGGHEGPIAARRPRRYQYGYEAAVDRLASYGACLAHEGGRHARHDGDGMCPACGEEADR